MPLPVTNRTRTEVNESRTIVTEDCAPVTVDALGSGTQAPKPPWLGHEAGGSQ
jgi:hypothetical protein